MLFALVPYTQRLAAGWGKEGVEGSLCAPNDTVCIEVRSPRGLFQPCDNTVHGCLQEGGRRGSVLR
jgi:hypothetical protein